MHGVTWDMFGTCWRWRFWEFGVILSKAWAYIIISSFSAGHSGSFGSSISNVTKCRHFVFVRSGRNIQTVSWWSCPIFLVMSHILDSLVQSWSFSQITKTHIHQSMSHEIAIETIPLRYHGDILRDSISKGVRHSGGAIQCNWVFHFGRGFIIWVDGT